MNAIKVLAAVLAIQAAAAPAEPLVGTWRLERQEVNGAQSKSEPLTLKIAAEGDKLAFAFSVPVNDVYFVSMTYTAKLDGSSAEVKNAHGETIGTIQLTASGPAQYKLLLKGPNRPDSAGKLTVSADGKTLISEAETAQAGRTLHSKQFFSRY
jgi:hypothetical protein